MGVCVCVCVGRGRQCLQTFRAPPVPVPVPLPCRPVHEASVAATEGRCVASVDATERGVAPRGGRRPQRGAPPPESITIRPHTNKDQAPYLHPIM